MSQTDLVPIFMKYLSYDEASEHMSLFCGLVLLRLYCKSRPFEQWLLGGFLFASAILFIGREHWNMLIETILSYLVSIRPLHWVFSTPLALMQNILGFFGYSNEILGQSPTAGFLYILAATGIALRFDSSSDFVVFLIFFGLLRTLLNILFSLYDTLSPSRDLLECYDPVILVILRVLYIPYLLLRRQDNGPKADTKFKKKVDAVVAIVQLVLLYHMIESPRIYLLLNSALIYYWLNIRRCDIKNRQDLWMSIYPFTWFMQFFIPFLSLVFIVSPLCWTLDRYILKRHQDFSRLLDIMSCVFLLLMQLYSFLDTLRNFLMSIKFAERKTSFRLLILFIAFCFTTSYRSFETVPYAAIYYGSGALISLPLLFHVEFKLLPEYTLVYKQKAINAVLCGCSFLFLFGLLLWHSQYYGIVKNVYILCYVVNVVYQYSVYGVIGGHEFFHYLFFAFVLSIVSQVLDHFIGVMED